jgi:membrane associated rhomboid family serine protease
MSKYQQFSGGGSRFSLIPPVIKTLIIINVAVFILQPFILETYSIAKIPIKYFLMLIPSDGFMGLEFYPWQLLSYQFLHGSIWHLFFNMFALWMFGVELEAEWGSKKFIIYYLLCGIGAGLVQLAVPYLLPEYAAAPTIGASGAVYGILLAFAMMFPNRPIFMFPIFIPIPAKIFVLIYAGIALFMGFSGSDGIAHFAHLGGAATGFWLYKFGDRIGIYKLFGKKKDSFAGSKQYGNIYQANWSNQSSPKYEYKPAESKKSIFVGGEEITQARIDEILDKISASGYQNLTEKEKQILFELSQKIR